MALIKSTTLLPQFKGKSILIYTREIPVEERNSIIFPEGSLISEGKPVTGMMELRPLSVRDVAILMRDADGKITTYSVLHGEDITEAHITGNDRFQEVRISYERKRYREAF